MHIIKMPQDLIHAMKLHPEMTNPGTAGSPDDSKVNRQEQENEQEQQEQEKEQEQQEQEKEQEQQEQEKL